MWRFPDRTTSSGAVIDAYLRSGAALDDGAIHLLFSANRWEKRAALLSALAAGTTLVVDRYAFSGVAFTAAKGAPGLGAAWCAAPDAGLPAPDAVLHLTLDPAAAAQRGGFGEERYEEAGMLATVAGMLDGMRADRAGGCEWARVDADGTIDCRKLAEKCRDYRDNKNESCHCTHHDHSFHFRLEGTQNTSCPVLQRLYLNN
jgi:dTMP kinase